jgi:hypothetical protein
MDWNCCNVLFCNAVPFCKVFHYVTAPFCNEPFCTTHSYVILFHNVTNRFVIYCSVTYRYVMNNFASYRSVLERYVTPPIMTMTVLHLSAKNFLGSHAITFFKLK